MSSQARKIRRDALRRTAKMGTAARNALVKATQGNALLQAQADFLINDINKRLQDEQKKLENSATVATLSMIFWLLHDKWGWGRERIMRLNGQIQKLNDDLGLTKVKLNEIIEQLQAETKIPVEFNGRTPFIFGGEPIAHELLVAQLPRIEEEKRIENEKAAASDNDTGNGNLKERTL